MSKKESYVISVSPRAKCYRHIQISGDATLLEFSSFILDSFNFQNDHLHAFFMNNRSFTDDDCYYLTPVEPECNQRLTSDYKLNQVGLTQGKKFKYVFDFGDEWTFQCKVLRVLKSDTPVPKIIRSKGKAPSQYGDDEEEDKDE